jgi:uncharacterized protein YoxC
MKQLLIISIMLLASVFVSGQELQKTSPEVTKVCQGLTQVKQGLDRIKGQLGEIKKCNTEMTQVSLKKKNLSLTPADNKRTISTTTGKETTNVITLTPADQTKGLVEVTNRMKAINGNLLKIKEKLIVEKTNIEQQWSAIDKNLKQITGGTLTSAPDHKCISDQLKELNNTVSALQIQTEKVRSETDELYAQLEQKYGQGSCLERVSEGCNLEAGYNCCDWQFSGERLKFEREDCRAECAFEFCICQVLLIYEEIATNINGIKF